MLRKKLKRALIDVCIEHMLVKKIAETLNNSDFESSDLKENQALYRI